GSLRDEPGGDRPGRSAHAPHFPTHAGACSGRVRMVGLGELCSAQPVSGERRCALALDLADRRDLPVRCRGGGAIGDPRWTGRWANLRGERSEEHTSELQSLTNLVCRLLLEKKKKYI